MVARPMDLGTIRTRLAPGERQGWHSVAYKNPAAVLDDVELVFQNCRAFYHPNDDIMCVQLLCCLAVTFPTNAAPPSIIGIACAASSTCCTVARL